MLIRYLRILPVVIITILFANCSNNRGTPTPAEKLQASLDTNWTQYKQDHHISDNDIRGAGIAVYLETPTGTYYSSSGMDSAVNQNTRFRIASNTKTFTAAAIMRLQQQGKLDIDHKITAIIPGKTSPAPFNPGYVYKNGVMTDTTEDNMSLHIGEGNIISTPSDIARWIRRLIRGEAGINSTLVDLMKTPTAGALSQDKNYGLGISSLSGLG